MTREDWKHYREQLIQSAKNEELWMLGSSDYGEEEMYRINMMGLIDEIGAIDDGDYEKVFEMNECETEKEFEEKYGYA